MPTAWLAKSTSKLDDGLLTGRTRACDAAEQLPVGRRGWTGTRVQRQRRRGAGLTASKGPARRDGGAHIDIDVRLRHPARACCHSCTRARRPLRGVERPLSKPSKRSVGPRSMFLDGYGFTPLRTPCDPLPASIPPSLGHPPSSRRGSREPRLPRLPLIICPPPRCQVSYQVAEWWPFVGLLRLRQVSRMSTKTPTHTLGPRTGPNSTNGSQLPHTRHTTQTLHYKFLRGQLQHQRNPPSLNLPLQLTLASSFAKK